MIDFKERIMQLCKEKGYTQKGLADKIGMSGGQLNVILRGIDPQDKTTKTYPSIKTLKRIADALGMELEDIFITEEVLSRHGITATPPAPQKPSFHCPHCGKEIELTLSTPLNQQTQESND